MVGKLFIFSVLAIPAVTSAAGDAALDRATLKGLKTVGVVIDHIDPQLPKEGVTGNALQRRLVERLMAAGITVSPDAQEFVGIQVSAVRGNRGPYAVSITIGLYQPVILARDSKIRTSTKTWEVETILMAEPKAMVGAAMDSVDDLAGRFAAAWKSVN